jgi:hypothetical protein
MIAPITPRRLFELGRLLVTPAALQIIRESGQALDEFLNRHIQGDWGHLFEEDKRQNDQAVWTGGRIVSVYRTDNGAKIRIVTDATDKTGKRVATIVLLPSEY